MIDKRHNKENIRTKTEGCWYTKSDNPKKFEYFCTVY